MMLAWSNDKNRLTYNHIDGYEKSHFHSDADLNDFSTQECRVLSLHMHKYHL